MNHKGHSFPRLGEILYEGYDTPRDRDDLPFVDKTDGCADADVVISIENDIEAGLGLHRVLRAAEPSSIDQPDPSVYLRDTDLDAEDRYLIQRLLKN